MINKTFQPQVTVLEKHGFKVKKAEFGCIEFTKKRVSGQVSGALIRGTGGWEFSITNTRAGVVSKVGGLDWDLAIAVCKVCLAEAAL